MTNYLKSALNSIWSSKVRSLLTLLGVVIGVASVTTLISLGQGLKQDVSGLIRGFGTNVMVVVGGKIDSQSGFSPTQTNPASLISGDILTLEDVESIKNMPEITSVSPISLVPGTLKFGGNEVAPTIFGAYPSVVESFQVLEVEYGQVFNSVSSGQVIVLGYQTAKDLFGDLYPLVKSVTLGKKEFRVIGTLGKSKSTSVFGSEFDDLNLIPFDEATKLNKDQVRIMRIVAKAQDNTNVEDVKAEIHRRILTNHGGEEDFSILTQDDLLGLFNQFLNLSTTLVSAIAAISLIVGGIGIMNIMLVTVTERTREIGLRKAVGATKRAILIQFLTEAILMTMVGGLIGLGISVVVNGIVALKTPLTPALSINVILITLGISTVIGIVFGIWPAMRAANKDPIEALRHE